MKKKKLWISMCVLCATIALVAVWTQAYAAVNAKYPSLTTVTYSPGETGMVHDDLTASVGRLRVLEAEEFIAEFDIEDEYADYFGLRDISKKILVDLTITYTGEEVLSPMDIFMKYIPRLRCGDAINNADSVYTIELVHRKNPLPETVSKGDTYTITLYFEAYEDKYPPGVLDSLAEQEFALVMVYYPKIYHFEMRAETE